MIPSIRTRRIDGQWKASLPRLRQCSPAPGSAALIIGTAGAKLRSEFASADAMLSFALWRRSTGDEAQSVSGSHGQNGTHGAIAESPFFPLLCTICGSLVWQGTRAVHTCAGSSPVLLNVRQSQKRFWLPTA